MAGCCAVVSGKGASEPPEAVAAEQVAVSVVIEDGQAGRQVQATASLLVCVVDM